MLLNLSTQPIIFNKGDRIAQIELKHNVTANIKEISYDELVANRRNSRGGFGSTGE